jgi:hypothetical protein
MKRRCNAAVQRAVQRITSPRARASTRSTAARC